MKRSHLLSLATALAVLLTATWASATTALKVDDREQAALSTAVVVAKVGAHRVVLEPGGRYPLTMWAIEVEETLYGVAPVQLELAQFGGLWEGRMHAIAGDAALEPGERCVLFLKQQDGRWFLTALQQSKYRIEGRGRLGEVLVRELEGGLVRWGPDGALEPW